MLAAPLGSHVLVESRATILQQFSPKPGQGYDHDAFLGLDYLQADIIANRHLTVVAGQFLTPFATYNERLTPIWISNFESAPLIFSLGTMQTTHSVGGMLRGSAVSNAHFNFDYAAYFSAASTNEQFNAQRSSGGRGSFYIPAAHLEIGGSYNRLLQGTHENFGGVHLWWEPADSSFRLRSEFATGEHARGYWIETGYRLHRFGGGDHAFLSGFEPVFRMQQTFRSEPDPNDEAPHKPVRSQAVTSSTSITTAAPRDSDQHQLLAPVFSPTGDRNIWQTGIHLPDSFSPHGEANESSRSVHHHRLRILGAVAGHRTKGLIAQVERRPSRGPHRATRAERLQNLTGNAYFRQNCARCHDAPQGFRHRSLEPFSVTCVSAPPLSGEDERSAHAIHEPLEPNREFDLEVL